MGQISVNRATRPAGTTPELSIAESAAEWLIELDDPNTERLLEFSAWLKTSPQHIEEFLLASAVWRELDGVDPTKRIAVQGLIREAAAKVRPWRRTQLRERAHRPARPWFHRTVIAISAAVALAALWALVPGPWSEPSVYATAKGEQRAFKLRDGSVVQLNTHSKVKVRFSSSNRDVMLIEGEALFSVAHDTARPFRVASGDTVIQAVGTQFDVDRRPAGTTVSVIEGIVQIASGNSAAAGSSSDPKSLIAESRVGVHAPPERTLFRLAAGEQATLSAGGHIVTRSSPELVAQVVAWRERRLEFREQSLGQIADEFNRYNSQVIRIADDAVRNKRLTGVLDDDDPESLVLFLEKDPHIAVERSSDTIIIRAK